MEKKIILCILILFSLFLIASCKNTEMPEINNIPEILEVLEISEINDCDCDSEPQPFASGLLPHTSFDDLFEQSSLVITGKVTGISQPFKIKSPSGSTADFIDYYITVSDIFRGNTDDEIIAIRTEIIHEPNLSLKENEEYLFFLYQPGMGGAFNTEGDYYYILGLTQGIFDIVELSEKYISQSGQELTHSELLERANIYPVDKEYFRREFIKNQQRNMTSGVFTDPEYFEKLLENIDVYAAILED